jgi:hypothetical protein
MAVPTLWALLQCEPSAKAYPSFGLGDLGSLDMASSSSHFSVRREEK